MKLIVSFLFIFAFVWMYILARHLQARAFNEFMLDRINLVYDQRDDLVSKYGRNYATEEVMERIFPKVNVQASWDNLGYAWPWNWDFGTIIVYGGRDYL